jgi:acyl-CoA thioester hydrolase
MSEFKFYHPLEVRYGDLDTQWHVNNVKFVEYLETARFAYIQSIGIWKGISFLDLGLIVASVQVSYLAPIRIGQSLQVGVRTSRLGNKSLNLDYVIEILEPHQVAATGTTVMVSYDYHTRSTIPVPEDWRRIISEFEGIPQHSGEHS